MVNFVTMVFNLKFGLIKLVKPQIFAGTGTKPVKCTKKIVTNAFVIFTYLGCTSYIFGEISFHEVSFLNVALFVSWFVPYLL